MAVINQPANIVELGRTVGL